MFQGSDRLLGMTARRQAKERGMASSRSVGGSAGLEATASRGACQHVIFSSSRPASKWEWVVKSSLAGDWLGGGGETFLLLPLIWDRK